MKNLTVIFIVLGMAVLGCKTQGPVANNGSESLKANGIETEETYSLYSVTDSKEKQDSLFASIEKGACFGNCPTYKMYIYNNGKVVLDAKRGIEKEGVYHASISYVQMNAFLTKAEEIGFEKMNAVYDNKSVTDLPAVSTSIVLNGKRKTVKRRYQYPREILELEKLFKNLLDTLDWEKMKEVSNN